MISPDISSETEELAWELAQERPDIPRIRWLIDDCQADMARAIIKANLKREDLTRKPVFRPLQKYLHSAN
jgi:hypothetical protein